MDGREAMSSYYLNRGIGSPPGLNALPAFRQMPSPNPSMAVHSSGLGSGSIVSAFQVESSSSAAPQGGVNVGGRLAGVGSGEPLKKRRGRPRKYGPEGTMSLALSPLSSTSPPGPASGPGTAAGSGSELVSVTPTPKRGRGRPPGTGRKQQLASLGEWVSGSAGTGFTPHVITIPVGEDITTKIMSFSQQGPRAVCILSANGAVSSVTLRQPASSGGTVTYEGRFEILCLSGSYFLTDDSGGRSRSGGLSASLSSPDGRVIGGEVGGTLIAASPVQVIVGSFIYGGSKQKNKAKTGQDLAAESEPPTGDNPSTPSSTLPNQSLSPLVMGGWPVSRQMDVRNPTIGIDLTQG